MVRTVRSWNLFMTWRSCSEKVQEEFLWAKGELAVMLSMPVAMDLA